ncbi:hypothetical protein Ga0466249_004835 [Sporomusaceae bacterium BoRhaA]|uniref:hypothetical protein n=1 Tax=Pelorhabdus rhamnosifermentans TaxID=2772457 RepID=UPI001C06219E|nr:hypothetical protein [Pelorhabdus rhamnosifermentans]MBU2703687.1 hypothetical protein [Pelorhabdus rhamnosifermentans]
MPMSRVSGIFGVREAYIAPQLTDVSGAATTWDAPIKIEGIKSLKPDPNVTSAENKGDEMTLDTEDIIDYYKITWENAELPLDLIAAIHGGDVSSSGTDKGEVLSYVYAGNNAQTTYFKLMALAKRGSNDTKDVMIEFYKVKGTLSFDFAEGAFAKCSFSGKAIRTKGTVDGKANALYGLKFGASALSLTGVQQVETATVAGTITTAGNATVTVTAAGLTGSPKAFTIPVSLGDTPTITALRIREALAADEAITALFAVSGTGANVVLTRIIAIANDATLNIAIANGTSAGLTAAPMSADTIAGQAS